MNIELINTVCGMFCLVMIIVMGTLAIVLYVKDIIVSNQITKHNNQKNIVYHNEME